MESNLKARIRPGQARRKQRTDRTVRAVFFLAALISGSCIVLITLFILMKGIQQFLPGYAYGSVSLKDFLLGTLWRQDQGVYGVGFIVINTLISAFGALLLAFPIAVLTALFIVILINQLEHCESKLPAAVSFVSALACLLIFGPDNFLLPALGAIVVLLLSLRGTLDEEKRNAACAAEALPQEVEKEWR